MTTLPTAEKPRIERVYVRYEGEGDDLVEIMCPKDEATSTHFVYTALHPVDGHEYGLMLSLTEVVDEIPEHLHNEGVGALERYMTEHPDGKDKNDE